MLISIEVPVLRGGWVMQCIDSVLQQTSSNWRLSLYWDQGDPLSRRILQELKRVKHPHIQIHFGRMRLGIARARQFLTYHSHGELILPLDDDDILQPAAVAHFLRTAVERPWAGIIRARRGFIDELGEPVIMSDWFPFERRQYFRGATCDISNHSQPYVIRRKLFLDTGGWQGFEDFEYLGEDCSCFTKIEEVSEVELLDEVLYLYRIHKQRTSLRFDRLAADEMWRRIADETNHRRRAAVHRVNDKPPFKYAIVKPSRARVSDVEVIIPFWETNERELPYYEYSRPVTAEESSRFPLRVDMHFSQSLRPPLKGFNRIEVAVSSSGPVDGCLSAAFFRKWSSFSPRAVLRGLICTSSPVEFEFVSIEDPKGWIEEGDFERMEITFEPNLGGTDNTILLHTSRENASDKALIRFFCDAPGYCRSLLDKCLASVRSAGIGADAIHVIEKRQSSAANRNEGFRECSKQWICFMDDDAQLENAAALQVMLDCMVEMDAALCGPKLMTASGMIYSGVPYTDPITLDARVSGMGEHDHGQYDINTLVPWLPSTVLMTHNSAVLATGGFDEHYAGSQHEDVDFCFRARARGFECCYAGRAVAIHHNQLRNGRFTKNMQYLKDRWKRRRDLFLWSSNGSATIKR